MKEFESSGYNGREVVLVSNGNDGYTALTGSHRVMAARAAGIDVPSVVIPMSEEIQPLLDAADDAERAQIADELFENGVIPRKIRDLISREEVLNYENFDKPLNEQVRFSMRDIKARKDAQFALIQNSNAAHDDYHTWIRSADEIRTLEETLADPEWEEYAEYDPDYTRKMAEAAIKSGRIRVYSSHKIGNGVFVSPSRMEAESYAADGKVYSKTVNVNDIAWIDPTQGQYAPVKVSPKYDYSKSFAEQVDDWEKGLIPERDSLVVGKTPNVFLKIGFNALPITINQTHVDYAVNGTKDFDHALGKDGFVQLPKALEHPVAIISSKTQKNTSLVAMLEMRQNGKQVVVPVAIDGFGKINLLRIDSNAITSVYGKKDSIVNMLRNALEDETAGKSYSVYYWDKEKTARLFEGARVPMPKVPQTKADGFVHSIRESGSPVKPKFENVTQSQQFKRWFGDWQNNPKSASKVVNKDGTPKVVYHGTNAKFWIFENKNGVHFFSESRDYAESMMEEKGGDRIVEAYLNIRNPLYVRMQEGAFAEPAQESKYIRQAKAEGYDGVVFELNTGNDIVDDTFYVVFNSNQIKSATDNIGTFSKSNPDIRFSRKDDVSVTAKDVQKLQKENDKLTQALDLVRQELKITQGHHVKPAVIGRLAGRILKDYQSTMPKTELVESITQLFDYIGNGERVIWDEVQAGAMNIALNVLDKSTQRNTEWYDATKPARDYLKNTAIKLNDKQLEEVGYAFGSYNDFRRALFGKATVSRVDGIPLEQAWRDLSGMFPDVFDPDTADVDMPVMLYNEVLGMYDRPIENPYGYDLRGYASDLAMQLYDACMSAPEVNTFADKQQKKLDLTKAH